MSAFSVTITNGIVSSLSFATDFESPTYDPSGSYEANSFTVSGGNNGTFSYYTSNDAGEFTQGTLTATDLVPEPTTLSLIGIAGTGLLLRRRRRA